jgi:hypothetical protein
MRGVYPVDYGALIIGFCVILFFVMVLVTASKLTLAQQSLPHPAPMSDQLLRQWPSPHRHT